MDIAQRFNFGAELIERNLKAGRSDAPAIWFGGKVLTYREVDALTDRFAAAHDRELRWPRNESQRRFAR